MCITLLRNSSTQVDSGHVTLESTGYSIVRARKRWDNCIFVFFFSNFFFISSLFSSYNVTYNCGYAEGKNLSVYFLTLFLFIIFNKFKTLCCVVCEVIRDNTYMLLSKCCCTIDRKKINNSFRKDSDMC